MSAISAAEQLEKSREIIKRLNEEKKKIVHEMEEKLRKTDDDMEVEKERLVQEVSRGKSAAITLMQVQSNFNGSNTFGTMKISSRRAVQASEG